MDEKDIQRINFLYRKSKESGLTEEEKTEQATLRRAYVDSVVGNLRSQLNNVKVVKEEEIYTAVKETVEIEKEDE